MTNKQMPDEEVLKQFGYNKEELEEYLKMLENQDHKHSCNCAHHNHSHNHSHCSEGCNDDDCDCGDNCGCQSHNHSKPKLVKMCVLEEGEVCSNCGACNMCDLDPNKVCDNCGKCLDELATDDKGYVHVPIDKIITGEGDDELDALLAAYGLDGDDDDADNPKQND